MIRAYIKAFLKPGTRAVLPGFATMVMKWLRDFKARVLADSGTVEDETRTAQILRFIENHNLMDDTKILICPEVAVKTRGTVPLYITKSYDLSPNNNDAVQTTETYQPFLAGNIAPNERLAIKNTQNSSRCIQHPQISFTDTEPWSLIVVINYEGGSKQGVVYLLAQLYNSGNQIRLNVSNRWSLYIKTATGTFEFEMDNGLKYTLGKNHILTYTASGDGAMSCYVDGVHLGTKYGATGITLDVLMAGQSRDTTTNYKGSLHYYRVQSGAMTLAQVQAEHAMLRSIYPEIESVQIGTQTWATSNLEMVATPMGNAIPEVTDAAVWLSSPALYSAAYTADTGTEEEKVYAGLKASAMWCHYNNDPVVGATYGKLYNWYAAKLLQTDIDAYNAANTTTPWGWKVPTREMNTTLSSEGGNASKFAGADYWTTDNGLNTNGLSLLGAGIRNSLGAFADIKLSTILVCSDALYVRNIVDGADTFAETAITTEGGSIRLIKT